MALDPTWIALIATVCGGVGLKVTEHWLGRNKVRVDDALQIRNELRNEISSQREEIKQLEAEADKWRQEYYTLKEDYIALKSDFLKVERMNLEAHSLLNNRGGA